jgi:HPt (histidine-containing phosphotransfer) domain-containing protein
MFATLGLANNRLCKLNPKIFSIHNILGDTVLVFRIIWRSFAMIDWARVSDLHDEIGRDGFSEVLELFLEETGRCVDLLRTAPDPDQLAMNLHSLRGGLVNLGFTEVSTLCERGEVLASMGQPDRVDTTPIVQAYDNARRTFLAELDQRLER